MILKNNLYKIKTVDAEAKTARIELIPDCMIYRAHFPEQPITPGVCIIQIATELLPEFFPGNYELTSVCNAKYLAVINPLENKVLDYVFKKAVFDEDRKSVKVNVTVCNEDTVFTKLSLVYSVL